MAEVPSRRAALRGPVAFLCEGTHDAAFLSALLRTRRICLEPDLPFFRQTAAGFAQYSDENYGEGALGPMLGNVASELDLDPAAAERLRGVIVVRDCGERSSTTLQRCKREIGRAGFAMPAHHGTWSKSAISRPPVAIVLIPAVGRQGGLESLCRDYLLAAKPELARCVDEFLQCIPPFDPPRTLEKHDKAAMACAVAGLHRDEPSMTMTRAFSGRKPLIDLSHGTFAPIADTFSMLLSQLPPSGTGLS